MLTSERALGLPFMVDQGQEGIMEGPGSEGWSVASLGALDGLMACLHQRNWPKFRFNFVLCFSNEISKTSGF